jgi:hypothetical protein
MMTLNRRSVGSGVSYWPPVEGSGDSLAPGCFLVEPGVFSGMT